MIQILQDRFSMYSNFELINDDVLKVDLKSLIKENKKDKIKAVKIVANLPYNNTNNNEVIGGKTRNRKYNCYGSKRGGG